MSGFFITKRMKVGISNVHIDLEEASGENSSSFTLNLAYDACLAWAEIAQKHMEEALAAMSVRRDAWSKNHSPADRAEALVNEFQSSMQAVVAAATCIDALYDHVSRHAPVSPSIRKAWVKNGTARYSQVAETLRFGFHIQQKYMRSFTENLKATYTLRDYSVHPTSAVLPAYPHPELDVVTEWKFTVFRGDVAESITAGVLGVLWETTRARSYRTPELKAYMTGIRGAVDEILPNGKPTTRNENVSFTLPGRSQ